MVFKVCMRTGTSRGQFRTLFRPTLRPTLRPTFITLAYDNRGGARCRTRRAGPQHHKGGYLRGQRWICSRGADMEWMGSAVFGEDTPSPVRVITRLFTAGGEEKEDSDDAGTNREMHPGRKRVYVRSQIASGLCGDLDGVKKKVWERVDLLFFEGRRRWLGPLWKKVKDLPPTTRLISDAWNGHVDGVAALEHRLRDYQEAKALHDLSCIINHVEEVG
ncbi:unnamed protein product [Ectocarpus sp. CCAP 1310/34]|nr:unnamed protein product [Ectocarpus sp. CCAP 1310/34]